MADSSDIKDTLNLIAEVRDKMNTITGKGSLIEYTQPSRVEPIAMVDRRATVLPYIGDVMNTMVNIFAGYYLQAVSLSTLRVGDVDVLHTLQKFNPTAPLITSNESLSNADLYEHTLPMPGTPSLEARGDKDRSGSRGGTASESDITKDMSDLSVGKMLDVKLSDGRSTASIQVGLRIIANSVGPTTMTHILSQNQRNSTARERYYGLRSGSLRFLKDIVLAQDLIDKHMQARVRDTDNVFDDIRNRRNKNVLTAVLRGGGVSYGTASNIIVITDQTRKEIEAQTGMRLDDFKSREKVFAETYTMLIAVINDEWEDITVYHRSLDRPTEMTVKDVKKADRKGGPDITEILKAYQMGNTPNL